MKPRILHLASERGWRGGEIQLALLLRGLAEATDGTLFVRPNSALAERCAAAGPVVLGGMGFLRIRDAMTVHGVLRKGAPAILHAHSGRALETALLARGRTGAPLVVSRRTAYPVRSGWKYRLADRVVAVSGAARGRLLAAGVEAERIVVVPDAVDPSRMRSGPARNGGHRRATVLCAAAFSPEKDHATLLDAWKAVEVRCDAELLVAGDGPTRPAAERQAAGLGLARVRFLGWRDDVAELIAGSDVAVLSSTSEGLSTFLCEAQWCGLPVAATDAGGIPDVVVDGETGLLSPPGDAGALADGLVRLIEDRDFREACGRAGMERARRTFAPEAVVEAHLALYRELLEQAAA